MILNNIRPLFCKIKSDVTNHRMSDEFPRLDEHHHFCDVELCHARQTDR